MLAPDAGTVSDEFFIDFFLMLLLIWVDARACATSGFERGIFRILAAFVN